MDKISDTKARSEYFHNSPCLTDRTIVNLPTGTAKGESFRTYENDIDDTIARLFDMCESKGLKVST